MRNMDEAYKAMNQKSKSIEMVVGGPDRTQQLSIAVK